MTDQKPRKPTAGAAHVTGLVYNPWLDMMRAGANMMSANIDLYQQFWTIGADFNRNLLQNYTDWVKAYRANPKYAEHAEEYAKKAREWLAASQDPTKLAVTMRDFLSENREWFRPFQEVVENQFEHWNIPPLDEQAYQATKNAVNLNEHLKEMWDKQIKYLPEPQKSWARYMLMFNEQFRSMYFKEGPAAWLESLAILSPGNNRLSQPDRNNLFLTENSKGEIVPVDEDDIIKLFPVADEVSGAKESFPRILITSSHADGSKDSNMTDITHGIQALVRDTQNGDKSLRNGKKKGLPLTHINGSVSAEPEKVLMLFACDSERNNSWNASRLMARMAEMDKAAATGQPDEFKEISPGAKRIARLILRCMLQDPNALASYAEDPRPIREIMADSTSKLILRSRPELVAQHFLLMGYSKGGNVVSDAMRYVIRELETQNDAGRDVFNVQHEHGHLFGITAHGLVSIKNIVRNIGCIAMAAIDSKLTDDEKDRGFRRLFFKNIHDPIANQRDFKESLYDEKIDIVGAESTMAHEPKKAMGKLRSDISDHDIEKMDEDEINKQITGYIVNDHLVARRLREAFAPYCGKAAIYDVRPTKDENNRECLLIETAPGTTDEMLQKRQNSMMRAFRDKEIGNLKNAKIEAEGGNTGIFRLYFDDPLFQEDGKTLNPETETKLRNSFMVLRGSQTVGLVIAQEIIKKLGGPEVGTEIPGLHH